MVLLRIPLTLTVTLSGDDVGQLLGATLTPQAKLRIEAAAREVLTRRVLQPYREALLKALPVLLTPDITEFTVTKLKLSLQQRAAYLALVAQRDAALLTGKSTKALDRQLRRAQQSVAQHLERRGLRALSTGQYRARLFEVFAAITNPDNLSFWWEEDTLRYGIGPLRVLNNIYTPSANPNKPRYPKALLWKQAEFGAGVYSTDPAARKRPWRFGPKSRGGGFTVRGIHGAGTLNALRAQLANPNEPWQRELRTAVERALV
jgi:hypothetical protein